MLRCAGFTLVEVLLAIFLFAMASTGLMQAVFILDDALNDIGTSDEREADIRFVRRHILTVEDRDELEMGDDIESLSSGQASWSAEIEETSVIDLFKVDLSIQLSGGDLEEAEVETTLYLLRPAWSEAIERSTLLNEKRREVQGSRDF